MNHSRLDLVGSGGHRPTGSDEVPNGRLITQANSPNGSITEQQCRTLC
ncbi:hypothetical protein ACFYZB_12240 [Streptomyces sp. NPDC001852]